MWLGKRDANEVRMYVLPDLGRDDGAVVQLAIRE